MTVRRRLLEGALAGGFGQAVTILTQLVSLPLFLRVWGAELYGEWLMLIAIPAYLAMSDVGFANAAANRMAIDVARGRRDDALEVFQSTIVVLAAASGLVAVAALVVSRLVSGGTALGTFRHLAPVQITVVIALLAAQVIVSFYGGLAAAGYRCEGRFARATIGTNLVRLAEFLASVVALWATASPVDVALATLVMRIVGTFAMFADLRRVAAWIALGIRHARWSCVATLLRPAFAFAAVPLGAAMLQQGVALVVGTALGPPALVTWSAARTASRVLVQASSLFNAPLWVEFSLAYGRGELGLARRLHRAAVQVSLWLVIPPALLLFLGRDTLFRVWSHGRVTVEPLLFALSLLQVVLSLTWGTSSVVTAAMNRHERNSLVFVLAASLTVLAAVPLTRVFGLSGTASALLITDVVMLPVAVASALRLVQDRPRAFLAHVLRPPFELLRRARA